MLVTKLLRSSVLATTRPSYGPYPTTAEPPYRIFFCGSDAFARTNLIALHEAKDVCSSLTILTARDAPTKWQSRQTKKRLPVSLVKLWAEEAGVDYEEVPLGGLKEYKLPPSFQCEASNNLLLTASFGRLLPQSLLKSFPPSQRLNLHPSLLPELSGAAPIQWAIARQMERTGVSIQTLGEKFDTGNILAQEKVTIPSPINYQALEDILAKRGSQLLLKVLFDLPYCAANAWPQSDAPRSLITSQAPKLTIDSDITKIIWSSWTASEIDARHRGFGHLYPLRATLRQLTTSSILLREIEVITNISTMNLPKIFLRSKIPGAAVYSHQHRSIVVKCKDAQSYINITRLQSEGKKEMEAADWIIGYKSRTFEETLLTFN